MNEKQSSTFLIRMSVCFVAILLWLLPTSHVMASIEHQSDIQQTTNSVIKLNAPIVNDGSIVEFQISPDGNNVVYKVAQSPAGTDLELYSVPINGGTPIKLTPKPSGGNVYSFHISPDGSRVVYEAEGIPGVPEIYSVPIGGGTSIQLSQYIVFSGSPDFYSSFIQISPNSSHVVYRSNHDGEVTGHIRLYSVPIGGGTPIALNPGGDASEAEISPDGSRVIYLADQDTDGVIELYSVPIGGGTSVKLNASLASGGDVSRSPEITSDGSRVIYLADQDTDGVTELYSVPIGGGTPIKLNSSLVSGGEVSYFEINPNKSSVVYHAEQEVDDITELYSVSVGGGSPIKLNSPLPSDHGAYLIRVSPTGERVIYTTYRTDQAKGRSFELYSVTAEGDTPIKLNASLTSGVSAFFNGISRDGSRVVYRVVQEIDNSTDFYSVSIEGGSSVKLNGPLSSNRELSLHSVELSSDGSRVLYIADQEMNGVEELYSVPIDGGAAIKLNSSLILYGNVLSYKISPDGNRVVYRADQEENGVHELYSLRLPATSLQIDKTVNIKSVKPEELVTYSVHVSAQNGLASFIMTDTLPSGISFERSSNPDVTYDAENQLFYNGLVEPDSPLEIIYTAQVEQGVAPGSLLYSEVVVSGLGEEYAAGAGFTVAQPESVPTLNLIYANGDNDLASEVQALFQKAETAAGNTSMTTLLLFDGAEEGDAYLYRLQPDQDLAESCPSKQNPTCNDNGNGNGRYQEGINMWPWSEAVGSHSSLVEFLVLAMQAYPAEQVTLSLVGHGGGWSPDLLPGQPRFHSGQPSTDPLGGLLWDLHPVSSLSTAQLGDALQEVTSRTGRKIDLLYLDACLMAMSEVAYEVRDSVNYLLASENWSWTSFRYNEHLSLDGNLSAKELGQQWLAHEADYLRERDYPFTYSLLDLSAADEMLSLENNLADALIASLPEEKSKIAKAFRFSNCFDGDQDFELLPTDQDDYYCDLASFAQQLEDTFGKGNPVSEAARALQTYIINQLVVQESHHNGRPWQEPSFLWSWSQLGGVSKYMPLGEEETVDDWKRAYYTSAYLQAAADGSWDEFLTAYWASATPPAPESSIVCGEECFPSGPAPINAADALMVTEDIYNTGEGTSLSVAAPGILSNDTDANGNVLTATLERDVTNGTLTLNSDGSFHYVPNANFYGMDNFTYRVSNSAAESSPVMVSIEVDKQMSTIFLPVVGQ